jgi:dihydropteroate synthase
LSRTMPTFTLMNQPKTKSILHCRHGEIDLNRPRVMGILNVTPDSFFDGGRYSSEDAILIRVEQMLEEGVDIIDIGAVSTRPGAKSIPIKEEISRLIPVLKSIRTHFPQSILSADTYRSEVAKEAVAAGADIINDVAGGNLDAAMFSVVGTLKVPYVLMHMQGTPENMQAAPVYMDVLNEVSIYFRDKIDELQAYGVEQILLDPGFGFGKNTDHNFELLRRLAEFKQFGFPIVAGLSRKSMINKVLGTRPENSLNGTTAANVVALLNGASVLRVHDVKEAVEAIQIIERCRS